jgi:F-type H+-transporting ATPase subunit b
MRFDWTTLALQTVNFAILVWLLNRFLYKPVQRMVAARRAEVEKHYADAREAEVKAKANLAAIEAEHAGIAAERAATLKDAAAKADEAAAARRVQAEREAMALLDSARKALAAEHDRALAEVRRAALDLGAEIAGRLLAEVPAKLREEAWLDRIGQHVAALPKAELEALVRQVADGSALKVVTASPLPAGAAETWRTQLSRTLGDRIAVVFEVDPRLVAGAELHFPNAVLRFSWQSALASMRAEAEARGNAH